MTSCSSAGNRVRERRTALGYTQADLALKAGISRTAVTAIEGNQLVPSVAAALALARSLETTVERIFGQDSPDSAEESWAIDPLYAAGCFSVVEVSGQRWRYPLSIAPTHTALPDPLSASVQTNSGIQTLVIATCDPAAGLLASLYERLTGFKLLVLSRSSREALELLKQGKVHCAGVHYSLRESPMENQRIVQQSLGTEHSLLHVAWWTSGITFPSSLQIKSVRSAVQAKLSWVWREPGACARATLEHLLGTKSKPRRIALGHLAVAQLVRTGWGDAGLCVKLASAEAGLEFLSMQEEAYELCIPTALMADDRVAHLVKLVRSHEYRSLLAQMPGYDTSHTGNVMTT